MTDPLDSLRTIMIPNNETLVGEKLRVPFSRDETSEHNFNRMGTARSRETQN